MKTTTIAMFSLAFLTLASCGSKKDAVLSPAVESSQRTNVKSLEGDKVNVETMKLTGIEMAETMNDDGTDIIKRPYKWFAGIGKADNKQVAIELAQREAYATISRVITNAVSDGAERGNIANNGRVQQALTAYWKQVSMNIEKGCEPFGNTTITFNQSTRMYEVTAKVGIRGDRFNQLLNTAGNYKPSDLTGDDLEQFIATNKAIMEVARGN